MEKSGGNEGGNDCGESRSSGQQKQTCTHTHVAHVANKQKPKSLLRSAHPRSPSCSPQDAIAASADRFSASALARFEGGEDEEETGGSSREKANDTLLNPGAPPEMVAIVPSDDTLPNPA
mmetsp:Transcript_65110/g.95332  ORF Transcript_65110/g.95332 Transcript_65110/m.95332 type:complete len:120 (+) Transcript_65110:2-361(+)